MRKDPRRYGLTTSLRVHHLGPRLGPQEGIGGYPLRVADRVGTEGEVLKAQGDGQIRLLLDVSAHVDEAAFGGPLVGGSSRFNQQAVNSAQGRLRALERRHLAAVARDPADPDPLLWAFVVALGVDEPVFETTRTMGLIRLANR